MSSNETHGDVSGRRFQYRATEQNQDHGEIPEETPEISEVPNRANQGKFTHTSVIEQVNIEQRSVCCQTDLKASDIITREEYSRFQRQYVIPDSAGRGNEIRQTGESTAAYALARRGNDDRNIQSEYATENIINRDAIETQTDGGSRTNDMKDYITGRRSYSFVDREEEIIDTGIDQRDRGDIPDVEQMTPIDTQQEEHRYHQRAQKAIPNCADVKLFENYYVLCVDFKIEKRDRQTGKKLDKLHISGAGRLCSIKDNISRIAVVRTGEGIVCLETDPELSFAYRIDTTNQYLAICHIETSSAFAGKPNPSHTFKATMTTDTLKECMVVLGPDSDRFVRMQNDYGATNFGTSYTARPYKEDVRRLSLNGITLSGITAIESVWEGEKRFIVIGCNDQVLCINYPDSSTVWHIPLKSAATDVEYMSPYVLVYIQNKGKVLSIRRKDGSIHIDNILEDTHDSDKRPHRVSGYRNTFLLKCYTEDPHGEAVIVEYELGEDLSLTRTPRRLKQSFRKEKIF